MDINAKWISDGYGEFVVYHKNEKGISKESFHDETWNIMYKLLHQYSLQNIVDTSDKDELELKITNRYLNLSNDIGRIFQGTIAVAFIPKTLFEIIYINQYVAQNLEESPHILDVLPTEDRLDSNSELNLQDTKACKLTYQMMRTITSVFIECNIDTSPTGLITAQSIYKLLDYQFEKLSKHYETSLKSSLLNRDIKLLYARIFSNELSFERAKDIMTRSTSIEISKPGHFLVYRPNSHSTPDALVLDRFPASFMTSLWAGFHDPYGNTTSIYFMHKQAEGYILCIPASRMLKKNRSVFPLHISLGSTLRQLASTNQPSHNWLKCPASKLKSIAAMEGQDGDKIIGDTNHLWHYIAIPEYIVKEIPKMQQEFNSYYNNRVIVANKLS